MACECIQCSMCRGTGDVWIAFDGEFLGAHRCDDLDEMESCPECGGDGIVWCCDECRYEQEIAEEKEWEREREAEERDRQEREGAV